MLCTEYSTTRNPTFSQPRAKDLRRIRYGTGHRRLGNPPRRRMVTCNGKRCRNSARGRCGTRARPPLTLDRPTLDRRRCSPSCSRFMRERLREHGAVAELFFDIGGAQSRDAGAPQRASTPRNSAGIERPSFCRVLRRARGRVPGPSSPILEWALLAPVIRLEGVTRTFRRDGQEPAVALHALDLEVRRGRRCA